VTAAETGYRVSDAGEYTGAGVWKKLYLSLNGHKFLEYANGTTCFFHADHLGTPRAQSNLSAAVVETWRAYPYGEQWQQSGGAGATHRYTGKERDPESANDYFGARYYFAGKSRWLSVDPESGDMNNPQSLNGYGYVLADPINYMDPDGKQAKKPIEGPHDVVTVYGSLEGSPVNYPLLWFLWKLLEVSWSGGGAGSGSGEMDTTPPGGHFSSNKADADLNTRLCPNGGHPVVAKKTEGGAYFGETFGNGQCVAFGRDQTVCGLPPTGEWIQGAQVQGTGDLPDGLAIAAGWVDGKYLSKGTGNHFALYYGQNTECLRVKDQNWGHGPGREDRSVWVHRIPDRGGKGDPSRDASAYHVVRVK
jgi:RHS repeat-associated protein